MHQLALATLPPPVPAAEAALPEGHLTDPMLSKHCIIRPLCQCYLNVITSLLLAGFLVTAEASGGQFEGNSYCSDTGLGKIPMGIDIEVGENGMKIARVHLFWLKKIDQTRCMKRQP